MLFEPLRVGGLELKNRICMPALHHNYSADGFVNEKLISYYETRSRGGAALIIVGGCSIDRSGGGPLMIGLHDDRYIPGLRQLAVAVKNAGAKIAAQLYQAGGYAYNAFTEEQPFAPSAITSPLTGETPREMTLQDIEVAIESFAAAALRAKEAGFDAVEVIASAGYLICQFLSPVTNLRTDAYGGSFTNRCRFGVDVVKQVRERVGSDFTILVRLSGHDFIPGGNTNSEAARFAAALENAGADCFNVTGGWHESRVPQITGHLPRGAFAYLARGVKKSVRVPVIAANRINDPAVAEQILRDGSADLVCMGRALIADPHLPQKAHSGSEKSIRRCIACNQGCLDAVFTLKEVHCTVNPLAGQESAIEITAARIPKRVLVVGGGPAGLEAACMSALRGHRVTLWEKGPRPGGQLHYAARPPGKEEFITLLDYYRHELAAAGVDIVLNRTATVEEILEFGADAVIIATGALPAPAPFTIEPGAPDKVINAWDILQGAAHPGEKVVVAGGGSVGCETALTVASMGAISAETVKFLMEYEAETPETLLRLLNRGTREVAIVEALPKLAGDMGVSTRWIMLKNLKRLGVEVLTRAKIEKVTPEGVLICKESGDSVSAVQTALLPADTVILAVGAIANSDLYNGLKDKVEHLYLVGDAAGPRKLTDAVREGFNIGRQI